MIRKMKHSSVFALVIASLSPQGPALALEDSEDGSILFGLSGAALCMSQSRTGSQVDHQDAVKQILIPERYRGHFESKGFAALTCSQEFRTERGREHWRNWVCTQSSKSSEAFQQNFERRFGEGAAILCAAAEFVSGPWAHEIIDEDGLTEAGL